MAESTDNKGPAELLRKVGRYWFRFLLGTVLAAVGVLQLAHHWWPVKYTGVAKFQRGTDEASQRSGAESFENIKKTLEHDLAGLKAVEVVAEDLKLFEGLPRDTEGELTHAGQMAKQEIVRGLRQSISISWDVKSDNVDLVTVKVTNSDAKLAQKIPNLLVNKYVDRTGEIIVSRLQTSRDFLAKRVDECNVRLAALRNKKIDFEKAHADAMPDSPGAIQSRIQAISDDIEALRIRRDTAKGTLDRLKNLRQPTSRPSTRPAATQEITQPNPEWTRLDEQLKALEDALEAHLIHRTEKHPTIVALKTQIDLLKKRISETPKELKLTVPRLPDRPDKPQMTDAAWEVQMASAESELEIADMEKGRLERRLEPLLTLMKNFARTRADYTKILEDIEKEEHELTSWRSRYTTVQMDLEAEVAKRGTQLYPAQAAQEQDRPSSPSLTIVLGLALVAALGVGVGLVLLSSMLDQSVRSTEDAARRFDLPVHGIISEIISRPTRAWRFIKQWVLVPTTGSALLLVLAASFLSVYLWLKEPQKYRKWQEDYVAFVWDKASDLKSSLLGP